MANIMLTQTFIDDFEKIGKAGGLDLLGELLSELKKLEEEIKEISLNDYIKTTDILHHVDNNGYVYNFKDLKLIAVIEGDNLLFIGILSKVTHNRESNLNEDIEGN